MKRVLVAPLDWGLGHATRCIPVIRALLQREVEVFLASSGDAHALLKKEFPEIPLFTLPAYKPQYPIQGSMVWTMVRQLPKFRRVIRNEHLALDRIIQDANLDGVISDNRYGCWSSRVPSIFITHQSNILMPKRFGLLAGAVRRLNYFYMKKFTACWIPDSPSLGLAGDLASFGKISRAISYRHVGPLSRFEFQGKRDILFDIAVVISGPEPQRTILEHTILPQLRNSHLKYFVVRGLPSVETVQAEDNVVDFFSSKDLQALIESAQIVLSRSGFSSVMDMAALRKRVIFIPTPGQTEQEYLASRLMQLGIAYASSQKNFDLLHAIKKSELYSGFGGFDEEPDLLKSAVAEFLSSI